jgi:hypothetical protein
LNNNTAALFIFYSPSYALQNHFQEKNLLFRAVFCFITCCGNSNCHPGKCTPTAPFSGGASAGTVTFTIDMTKYAAGMYLLEQEDGTTQKIIKE